ncbi:MAG: response regulator [bacterium]|nr:response regulator [bacterium]
MSKKKVLVIEDNHEMRDNIVELLELSNYEVFNEPDGKAGVKTALNEIPDIIICDIMMPGMDGYEVLYLLSKNVETSGIPFIFLTAKAEKSDFRKGMSLGADDYLTKPFDEMDLLSAIEQRLKKHELLKENSQQGLEPFLNQVSTSYKNFEDLIKDRKTRSFDKKESIYKEGDFSHYLYYIKSGRVKLYKINSDGKEFIVDVLKEGDFFGQLALIQDINYTEFAEALETTEVLLVPRADFQELIFSSNEISSRFIKMISKDLADKEGELMRLAYNTVRKRTADALKKLIDEENKEFSISRDNLSSIVGTATESVIRVLSEFKKDGIIKIEGGKVTVLSYDKLSAIKY